MRNGHKNLHKIQPIFTLHSTQRIMFSIFQELSNISFGITPYHSVPKHF